MEATVFLTGESPTDTQARGSTAGAAEASDENQPRSSAPLGPSAHTLLYFPELATADALGTKAPEVWPGPS